MSIIDILVRSSRYAKKWIMLPDNIELWRGEISGCQTDIKSLKSFTESINTVVIEINNHGSKGAVIAIKEVSKKVDAVGSQVSGLGERIAHLEGIVVNGHKD